MKSLALPATIDALLVTNLLNVRYLTGFSGSSRKRAEEIASQLERAGIPATVRRELGSEIDGACGQLRLKEKTFENQSV